MVLKIQLSLFVHLVTKINNIFELRLDARKFLIYYRRPVPRRVSDIGIWLGVMSVLGRISVITTAFISEYCVVDNDSTM